jgi:hypothetical protein
VDVGLRPEVAVDSQTPGRYRPVAAGRAGGGAIDSTQRRSSIVWTPLVPPDRSQHRAPLLGRLHDAFHDDLSAVADAYADSIRFAHRPSVQRLPDGRHDGIRLRQTSDLEPIRDVLDPFEPTDRALRLFSLDWGRYDSFERDHATADCRPNLSIREQGVPLEGMAHRLGDVGVR